MKLTPCIFFKGNCQEAMEFYQSVLGGELTLQKYNESVGVTIPEGWEDKIIHATLTEGDVCLTALDSPIANPEARKIELSIMGTDENRMREIFAKLTVGGKAKHPLEKQYDGSLSGRLFDKYGLDWIVNINNS